uniref:1-acylglycerol-3-phosphate O-acyltransferase n=1 Tax=Lygus hesperus TaxID=30085 RepID=A0A0A9YNU8_LYGHE
MMSGFEFGSICLFLLLPVLYEHSNTFRYYFKFFVYYGYIMVTSVVVLPIMLWNPRSVENLILASKLCRHISTLLRLRWELRGGEYLNKQQSFVIVANHQSSIDILDFWLCLLPFWMVLQNQNSYLNVKIWVFPEGTRKNTGEIHAFKKGAFHAAISAQLPILPVVFTRFYFLQSEKCIFNPGKIVITVLPPIKTCGLNVENLAQLMTTTHTTMTQTFNNTSKELLKELKTERSYE